jgi:hypothetical protein
MHYVQRQMSMLQFADVSNLCKQRRGARLPFRAYVISVANFIDLHYHRNHHQRHYGCHTVRTVRLAGSACLLA